MSLNSLKKMLLAGGAAKPGQIAFTTPGTYQWTVPAGVSMICGLAVGGGSGGLCSLNDNNRVRGGSGGGLSWGNGIPVTPGETLTIEVGAGGLKRNLTSGSDITTGVNPGGSTRIMRGSAVLLEGEGGRVGINRSQTNPWPLGGRSLGSARQGGGGGGDGGKDAGSSSGGGGAGGYSGNGGNGGSVNRNFNSETDGAGGGGGGAAGAGGGGGVGILGQGQSGSKGNDTGNPQTPAGGGSGGAAGGVSDINNNRIGSGGRFGGGGSGRNSAPGAGTDQRGGDGGGGAARILWGRGRAFPATNTGDM